MCLVTDSAALTVIGSCGICFNMMFSVLISIFLFIWFILGCIWTFGVRSQVQFNNPSLPNYCQPTLYKWTFALLIITIVWAVLQCCFSCCKGIISSHKKWKFSRKKKRKAKNKSIIETESPRRLLIHLFFLLRIKVFFIASVQTHSLTTNTMMMKKREHNSNIFIGQCSTNEQTRWNLFVNLSVDCNAYDFQRQWEKWK